jgi:hypothetical protein
MIAFDYNTEEMVVHAFGEPLDKRGMIIARLDMGSTHLYLVSWGHEAPTWHIEAELKRASDDHD